jgi:protein transport protein SEC31
VLVVLCTFAQSKDFGPLCEVLGDRLLKDAELSKNATLFYLAAGNLEKVSSIWISQFEQEENNQDSVTFGVRLQELVEKVTIFRKAIDFEDTAAVNESGDYVLANLYDKYCQYAEFMATQGKLDVALKYISLTPAEYANGKARVSRGSIVHDRVFHASASQTGQYQKPSFPFEKKLLSSKKFILSMFILSMFKSKMPINLLLQSSHLSLQYLHNPIIMHLLQHLNNNIMVNKIITKNPLLLLQLQM